MSDWPGLIDLIRRFKWMMCNLMILNHSINDFDDSLLSDRYVLHGMWRCDQYFQMCISTETHTHTHSPARRKSLNKLFPLCWFRHKKKKSEKGVQSNKVLLPSSDHTTRLGPTFRNRHDFPYHLFFGHEFQVRTFDFLQWRKLTLSLTTHVQARNNRTWSS